LLRGPITEFPKFRGQSENVSFGRNVAVAGGRAVWSSPFRFNRKPENLQQIQSWTTSLAHDLIRGRYSPAKAGLIRGKLWVSIKGSIRPSTRGGKNQPRKTELRTKKKKQRKQSTNPNTERKREQKGSTQWGELSLKLSSDLQTKKKPGFSQRTLTASSNLLCRFRSCWEIKKESTDKWSQKEGQRKQ